MEKKGNIKVSKFFNFGNLNIERFTEKVQTPHPTGKDWWHGEGDHNFYKERKGGTQKKRRSSKLF